MGRSVLMGRRRQSVTEYHYDDEDRLVRAVTTHDAEFTDDDTDAVLERAQERARACAGCGQPRDEVWPEGPDDALEKEREWAAAPMKCVACAERDRTKRKYEASERPDRDGIHFVLQRRD